MSEEEAYQVLKEIVPELEAKLRQSFQMEYQQQLQKAQLFYRKYADEMISKKEMEIRRQAQQVETHLRRQLSLIQKQRQQWLLLEQDYRKTIFELTAKLRESSQENELSLTQIMHQNITQPDRSELDVGTWKKKSKFEPSQAKPSRKDSQNSIVNANININSFSKALKQTNSDNRQIEERPKDTDSKKKWKISEKNGIQSDNDRGKRQDTLILSPPKIQEGSGMKSSLLQPPSEQIPSKSSIFWNEEGKKKFLSMIRSIK